MLLADSAHLREVFGARTLYAAQDLQRLRDAHVGVDRQNEGKFAVYFLDGHGEAFRTAGGFASPSEASAAVYPLWVEAVEEAIAQWEHSQ